LFLEKQAENKGKSPENGVGTHFFGSGPKKLIFFNFWRSELQKIGFRMAYRRDLPLWSDLQGLILNPIKIPALSAGFFE